MHGRAVSSLDRPTLGCAGEATVKIQETSTSGVSTALPIHAYSAEQGKATIFGSRLQYSFWYSIINYYI